MEARYQCYTHGDGWYWRLLGANNRVLARCPDPFDSPEEAVKDARSVAYLAAHARVELVTDTGAAWRWVLLDRGVIRAVSAVPYARRTECLRAVSRFRAGAALAEIGEEPLVFPPTSGPAGRGPRVRPVTAESAG